MLVDSGRYRSPRLGTRNIQIQLDKSVVQSDRNGQTCRAQSRYQGYEERLERTRSLEFTSIFGRSSMPWSLKILSQNFRVVVPFSIQTMRIGTQFF